MCSADMFLGLIAILFPPLAVWVKTGLCSADSLINICLCMLGYVPGLLHAWYIIAKFPEPDYYEPIPGDAEGGRVTYIVVSSPNGGSHRVPAGGRQPGGGATQGYGTTAPMAPQVHQETNGTWSNAAEGSSNGAVPPSYEQAVKGDNKIQSRD
ncbi:probable SNA2 Integral mebrane protein [Phialocephala subalpina]|uniref:Probable SNA2 Integral mebrane protein n=1 Tax=Phialocephala subalpina TaxID=576137 RepID=A0A1L7XEK3_9HELO|nr:probable SNA2 Integral mebrane protein [Phialocephala subalpina]